MNTPAMSSVSSPDPGTMDLSAYAVEAAVEQSHWWFNGRRRLFAHEIARLHLAPEAPILDIGTGTGANLRVLKTLGFRNIVGFDLSDDAIRYCASKGLGAVRRGDICALPTTSDSINLVMATDIVEHVDDDALALREIARVLAPGGHAMIAVPAFPSLWGRQDEVSHHKRRYRRRQLEELVSTSGLRPARVFYFNYLLFAPIWLVRQAIRILRLPLDSELQINRPLINRLLTLTFALDIETARRLRIPFGVSLFCLAKKPAT